MLKTKGLSPVWNFSDEEALEQLKLQKEKGKEQPQQQPQQVKEDQQKGEQQKLQAEMTKSASSWPSSSVWQKTVAMIVTCKYSCK